MNLDEIRQILDLVREHELAEFELERDGLKIRVRKDTGGVPVLRPAEIAAGGGGRGSEEGTQPAPDPMDARLVLVKSPIVGTVYQAPEPGAPPFVEIGQRVRKGQVLCIIEAMKLMNEIDAECDGEVAAIYVENGRPVQYGDRLFAIKVA